MDVGVKESEFSEREVSVVVELIGAGGELGVDGGREEDGKEWEGGRETTARQERVGDRP